MDPATMQRLWRENGGLLVRSFVTSERPERMLQLGRLL
jgi:hypothetical protein